MLLDEYDNVTEIDLPVSEGVATIHLPIVEPPAILTGATFNSTVEFKGIDTIHVGKNPVQVASTHGKTGIRFEDKIDLNAYLRIIAKIAHAYHVANLGLFSRSESPLLPLILSKAKGLNNWIGNAGEAPNNASDDCGQILWCTHDNVKNINYTCLKMFASHPGGTYVAATRVPGWALYS